MKFFFLISLAVFSSSFAQAACKLPRGEKIIIGCTYKCDFFTRSRLKAAGARLGYKVAFKDLSANKSVSDALSSVDSVVIPGGADIHPKFYLKDVTPELRAYTENNLHLVEFTEEGKKRDLFEYTLVKRLINSEEPAHKKLPLFGICRGMQMLSVAQGIPLYLDIKTELGIPNRRYKFDRIHITEEGLMSSLYGDKKFSGWEMHHQGIRVDYFEAHRNEYPNVRVTAYSNDGKVAEAIEYKDMTALGVQYHPEKSLPKATYPLFKWLLTKACEYKTTKDTL